jgi:hypothetical protein
MMKGIPMNCDSHSVIIYKDVLPVIPDMGLLTSLCLLHDEVLIFGGIPEISWLNLLGSIPDDAENSFAKTELIWNRFFKT